MATIYVLPRDFSFRHFPTGVCVELIYDYKDRIDMYLSSISKMPDMCSALKLSSKALRNMGGNIDHPYLKWKIRQDEHWITWIKTSKED